MDSNIFFILVPNRQLTVFICSIVLLFITILLRTGSLPLKIFVFVLLVEIFSPYLEVNCLQFVYRNSLYIFWLCRCKLVVRDRKCLNVFISWNFDSFYLLFFPFSNNDIYIYIYHYIYIYIYIYIWIKIDKLDVICFIISLFTAQHVSNVSTSIFRSLRLIVDLFHVLYCTLVLQPA